MRGFYFDYAATTPIEEGVFSVIVAAVALDYANPGALHDDGAAGLKKLIEAREIIASAINASLHEVIFLPSATIANNLAITGLLRSGDHLIVSSIEHPSVYETAVARQRIGEQVSFAPVNSDGSIDLVRLKNLIRKETRLISVMMANNETGVIQTFSELVELIRECNKNRSIEDHIYIHTDAVQVGAYLPIDVGSSGVDLLTLSSHKMYGPKGVACLYVKKNTPLRQIIYGGGQEYGFWSGTENLPAILGFAAAMRYVIMKRRNLSLISELRDYIESFCERQIVGSRVYGGRNARLPGILNIGFDGISSEQLVYSLNAVGCFVSSVSACSAKAMQPSRVIMAMGFTDREASSTIRISLGYMTTQEEVVYLTSSLGDIIKRLRS